MRLPTDLQNRQRPLKRRVGAARHDGEIARFRADLSAGDGCIDPRDSLGELLRRRHAGGAEVDDHRARAQSFDETILAEHDLLDHVGRRQVDANDAIADLAREFRQRRRALHADARPRLPRVRRCDSTPPPRAPASWRWRAIARPMLPSPTNPILCPERDLSMSRRAFHIGPARFANHDPSNHA